jgi:hypothetical protein
MEEKKLTKEEFSQKSYTELRESAQKGEPNTTRRVKAKSIKFIQGEEERVILDVLGRVWFVPKVVDRDGKSTSRATDCPLELHLDEDGAVSHAKYLHPYYDKSIPLSSQERAMARYYGYPPVNAGYGEPYEGDDLE